MLQRSELSPDTVGDTAQVLRAWAEPVPLSVIEVGGTGWVAVPAWVAVLSLLAAVAIGALITWAALWARGRRSD